MKGFEYLMNLNKNTTLKLLKNHLNIVCERKWAELMMQDKI